MAWRPWGAETKGAAIYHLDLDLVHAKLELVEIELILAARVRKGLPEDPEGEARRRMLTKRAQLAEAKALAQPDGVLRRLYHGYGLSVFERDVFWLVLVTHLDLSLGELISHIYNDPTRREVTPWLCQLLYLESRRQRLEALGHLSAEGKLVRRGLLSLRPLHGGAQPWLDFELSPASFLLGMAQAGGNKVGHELAEVSRLVPTGEGLDVLAIPEELKASWRQVARQAVSAKQFYASERGFRVYDFQLAYGILLTGPGGSGKTLALRGAAAEQGRGVLELDGSLLALRSLDEATRLLRRAFAFAALNELWLHLDGVGALFASRGVEAGAGNDRTRLTELLRRLLQEIPVTVCVSTESIDDIGSELRDRFQGRIEMKAFSPQVASLCWQLSLPEHIEVAPEVDFDVLAQRYPMSGRTLQNALNVALRSAEGVLDQAVLEAAASSQLQRGLGQVARRTYHVRSREDLILPGALSKQVDEIIAIEQVRESVLKRTGLGSRFQKGLGLTCLFDGEPGTGKTLTAEVIASVLGLPLFTVNIAHVVSKWVGETEKNLQQIFDEAKRNQCVVLFDEADTLFSKRTSVSGSMDRHSNMEVGLLLQLVEDYRGLVVLTTNLKTSIDEAFMRRFAFKLNFPLPDNQTREAIWRRMLPQEQLHPDVNIVKLAADYPVAGGSIRTIVLRAAYQAELEGTQITSEILRGACVRECQAMGMLVREA